MEPDDIEDLKNEVHLSDQVKRLKVLFLDSFFKQKEQQLFDLLRTTPLGDAAAVVAIHHQLKSLNALQVEIQSYIDTGKMAQVGLDDAEKL